MYFRKKNKKIFAVIKKNGHEKWYGGNTKEEAIKKALESQSQSCVSECKSITLNEFSTYYIANSQLREKTTDSYKYALKKLCEYSGEAALDDIKPVDIQSWITSMSLSVQTKRDYYAAVRTAFKRAVSWGLLEKSPCEGISIPKPRQYGKALSRSEIELIINKAPPHLRLAISLGAFCGLRIGEICGLRHTDIVESTITVRYQLQRKRTVDEGDIELRVPTSGKTKLCLVPPKTASSADTIIIPTIIIYMLSDCRKNNDKWHTGLVLLQPDGQPYEASTIRKQFRKLCRECGIQARLHDLRHTAATLLLQAGVDPLTVARQLRHSDVHTTQAIYQHLTPKLRSQPAKVMDDLFLHGGHGGINGGIKQKIAVPNVNLKTSGNRENTHISIWSGRRDSNSRPLVPETVHPVQCGSAPLFLLVGIKFFILTRYNFVFLLWTLAGQI